MICVVVSPRALIHVFFGIQDLDFSVGENTQGRGEIYTLVLPSDNVLTGH